MLEAKLLESIALTSKPAPARLIQSLRKCKVPPPEDYLEFLAQSDGGDLDGHEIFPAATALEWFKTKGDEGYGLRELGLLYFATDSAGTAFCFFVCNGKTIIAAVDLESPSKSDQWDYLADSFAEWVESIQKRTALEKAGGKWERRPIPATPQKPAKITPVAAPPYAGKPGLLGKLGFKVQGTSYFLSPTRLVLSADDDYNQRFEYPELRFAVFDFAAGRITQRFLTERGEPLEPRSHWSAISSDRSRLFARPFSEPRTLRIWDTATCAQIKQMTFNNVSFGLTAIVPAGATHAFGTGEGPALYKIQFDTGEAIVLKTESFYASHFTSSAHSPDGRHLLLGTSDNLYIIDQSSGDIIRSLCKGSTVPYRVVAFTPDSSKALCYSRPGDPLCLIDLATHAVVAQIPPEVTSSAAFSPDGSRLATLSTNGSVQIFDGQTLQRLKSFKHPGKGAGTIAVSPDFSLAVTRELETNELYLWRLS